MVVGKTVPKQPGESIINIPISLLDALRDHNKSYMVQIQHNAQQLPPTITQTITNTAPPTLTCVAESLKTPAYGKALTLGENTLRLQYKEKLNEASYISIVIKDPIRSSATQATQTDTTQTLTADTQTDNTQTPRTETLKTTWTKNLNPFFDSDMDVEDKIEEILSYSTYDTDLIDLTEQSLDTIDSDDLYQPDTLTSTEISTYSEILHSDDDTFSDDASRSSQDSPECMTTSSLDTPTYQPLYPESTYDQILKIPGHCYQCLFDTYMDYTFDNKNCCEKHHSRHIRRECMCGCQVCRPHITDRTGRACNCSCCTMHRHRRCSDCGQKACQDCAACVDRLCAVLQIEKEKREEILWIRGTLKTASKGQTNKKGCEVTCFWPKN